MSTDRELLQLAAKAARYIIESHTIDGAWVYPNGSDPNNDGEWPTFLWRPEQDDGDALRLAVSLRMSVDFDRQYCEALVFGQACVEEVLGPDALASTRRAIVRAAAEIGRSMP